LGDGAGQGGGGLGRGQLDCGRGVARDRRELLAQQRERLLDGLVGDLALAVGGGAQLDERGGGQGGRGAAGGAGGEVAGTQRAEQRGERGAVGVRQLGGDAGALGRRMAGGGEVAGLGVLQPLVERRRDQAPDALDQRQRALRQCDVVGREDRQERSGAGR